MNTVVFFFVALFSATGSATDTVATIIATSPVHGNLTGALTALNAVALFNNTNDPYTVFAPTDSAFAAFGLGNVPQDTADLGPIILYHAINASVSATQAIDLDGQSAPTLNGKKVHINGRDNMVWVNGIMVTQPIMASNGYVHVITSNILVPPMHNASEPGNADDALGNALSTLQTLIDASSLTDALNNPDATFTVFAPSNAAFTALFEAVPGLDTCLLGDQAALDSVLRHHVLGAGAYSGYLQDMMATTLNMDNVTIAVTGNSVTVGNANVTVADITLNNGVAHVIDAVLVPPDFDACATCGIGCPTIADIISGSPAHGDLTDALVALMAVELFDNASDPYTVFAPTDSAFAAFGLANVPNDTAALAPIILYHALSGGVSAAEAIALDGMSAPTLNGKSVHINGRDGMVWVNGIMVTQPIEASNGWVHVIDSNILVPPVYNASEPGNADDALGDALSTLQSLIDASSLAGALADHTKTYTVFAPNNDAFDALFAAVPGLDTCLLGDQAALDDILRHHVLGAGAYSGYLQDMMVTTLNGDNVSIAVGAGVSVGDATVAVADITLTNGVAHVIDAVLVPPGFDACATCGIGCTIAEIISGSADHGNLTGALVALDAVDLFNNASDPYTVFAPTDSAFAAFGLANVPTDANALAPIILYHALSGGVSAAEAIALDGMSAPTLNGKSVHINGRDNMVWVNGIMVTQPIMASNGWVHVIDSNILVPPVYNASEPGNADDALGDALSTLQSLIDASSLAGALADHTKTYTVFAPNNDAFDALFAAVPGLDTCLLGDQAALDDVLRHHVLGAGAYSGYLQDMMATTLNGDNVSIAVGGGVSVGDATVAVADITLTNGVAHVIDAVLVPPSFDPCATCGIGCSTVDSATDGTTDGTMNSDSSSMTSDMQSSTMDMPSSSMTDDSDSNNMDNMDGSASTGSVLVISGLLLSF